MEIILVPLVIAAGSMVQSSTGFGFGLIVTGLLIDILGPKDAVIVQMVVSLCLSAVVFWRLRSHFNWEKIKFILLGMVLMVPVGLLFFLNAEIRLLKLILGMVLVAVVIHQLVPKRATKQLHPVYAGIQCGLFSGLLAGAFGAGGPPIVAYMAGQKLERHEYVASVQFLFVISALIRVVSMTVLSGGLCIYTGRVIFLITEGLVAVAIGSSIGLYILCRLPERAFRFIVYLMLLILGVRYICSYWTAF